LIRGFLFPPGHERAKGAVEAETRPIDAQALDRKLALKERDGGADWLLLLLANTHHNRTFVKAAGAGFRARFPLESGQVLDLLAAGADPGGNAIVLL
jgi:hypothetical protein